MNKRKRQQYEPPQLTVVSFQAEMGGLFASESENRFGNFSLGNMFFGAGGDPWLDEAPTDNNFVGTGWTDYDEDGWN